MQKKLTIIVAVVVCLLFALWVFSSKQAEAPHVACTMDALICPDGTSVGRTGPNCEFAQCPTPPTTYKDLITVTSPLPNETIQNPITVKGRARGTWFFEASFPIIVVDWDGRIIGEGYAQADGDWMTPEFVPFTGTITYTLPEGTPYLRGALIFKKDNPSGLPEHDDAYEMPILFSDTLSTMQEQPPAEEVLPPQEDEMVACTMDAKQCPDGSYVGRVAPLCEFAPCPGPTQ